MLSKSLEKKFKKFSEEIKNCYMKVYSWNSSDLCIQKCDSYSLKKLNLRFGAFFGLEKRRCKCDEKLPYECNRNICAKNKSSCDHFNSSKNSTIKLNYCL